MSGLEQDNGMLHFAGFDIIMSIQWYECDLLVPIISFTGKSMKTIEKAI